MTPAGKRSTAALFMGLLLGAAAGYVAARASEDKSASPGADHTAELAEIRAELAEVKTQVSPTTTDEQVKQLQAMVSDILLRGDEFSLRADFARTADRLDGHRASEFVLRDADQDGTEDLEQMRQTVDGIVAGKIQVARAKKAESADNAEFLGNLPLTDFALADHTHESMTGNVRLLDNLRVDGTLTASGNMIASGDIQVFGEVVAVGGLLPGAVDIDPKPAIAGMIRYNRRLGTLEYCDGTRWNEIAVAE